jgi:hypothetical protein
VLSSRGLPSTPQNSNSRAATSSARGAVDDPRDAARSTNSETVLMQRTMRWQLVAGDDRLRWRVPGSVSRRSEPDARQ